MDAKYIVESFSDISAKNDESHEISGTNMDEKKIDVKKDINQSDKDINEGDKDIIESDMKQDLQD